MRLDEVPAETTGVAFVDVESGEAELWTAIDGDIYDFAVDDDHRWLLAWIWTYRDDGIDSRWTLTDRRTGESYLVGWEPVGRPSAEGLALFRTDDAVAVVDLAQDPTDILVRLDVPGDGIRWSSASSTGDRRFVASFDDALYFLDVDAGSLTPIGAPRSNSSFVVTDGGEVMRLGWERDDDGNRRWLHLERFDQAGRLLDERTIDGAGTAAGGYGGDYRVSPDGRWVAWQGQLLGGVPYDLGVPLFWPIVTFANLDDGTIRFRAVQASQTRYQSDTLGWLADSSGLLVASPDGYAVVRVDGSVERLPLDLEPVPVAAPHDAGLFVYGGQVLDLGGDARSPAVAVAERWANGTTRYRTQQLRADGGELRFVHIEFLAGGGGTGAVEPLGPGLRVEPFPFDDAIRLRYAGSESVKVRTTPRSSGVVAELQPEDVVTHIAGPSDFCRDADRCMIAPNRSQSFDEAWLIHVRTESGAEGWVAPVGFEWADEGSE
jgi:hypothetical protein